MARFVSANAEGSGTPMNIAESGGFKNDVEREEWFLAQLEKSEIPAAELLGFLRDLRAAGRGDLAEMWAELLQDALAGRGQLVIALGVLQQRMEWDPAADERWKESALGTVEPFREPKALAQHAGFDRGISPAECVRRLVLLLQLKPGVLCLDKTWGFGVIQKTDTFYARVEVDFERKKSHPMSFAYAAEALQLLGDDHLLVVAHREPDRMKAMVQGQAGEVVRMTLRSYGPLTVQQLQEQLVPRLLPEADWKRFWDAARRELKRDDRVHIPARRTERIELLEKAKAYDSDWLGSLSAERDLVTILNRVEKFIGDGLTNEDPAFRRGVGERLAFVARGATSAERHLVARAVMAAQALGVESDQVNVAAAADDFLAPDVFLETTRNLPARAVNPFIRFLAGHDRQRTADLLLRVLKQMNLVTLNEGIDFLAAEGFEVPCADILRDALAAQTAEVELLYWISRNMDRLESWSLGTVPYLAQAILVEMGKDYNGESLKAQNQLRVRFEQPEWLKATFAAMNDIQRRDAVLRIKESSGWGALDRQSLLGQIVKLYPDLLPLLASKGAENGQSTSRGPLTSARSYRERQLQLEKLIKVDIPQNSKEIAVARSYGDLSENHEFKAAKEMQGILLRRRGELEAMLHRVKPTDFRGFSQDRAGMATGVLLRYDDGREERYCILGEWDKDDALGIISCDTRMARALEGHQAGERVKVPAENGEAECALAEVTGVPAEVRVWIEANVG